MRGVWAWIFGALIIAGMALYGVQAVKAQDQVEQPGIGSAQAVTITVAQGAIGATLSDLSYLYNICPERLYEAHALLFKYPDNLKAGLTFEEKTNLLYIEANALVEIPSHQPCYDIFRFEEDKYSAIFALEQRQNVCWEEFIDGIKAIDNEDYTYRVWHVYVPRVAPPCYNNQHQRLTYYTSEGKQLAQPYYSDEQWIQLTVKEFADVPYCRGDLVRVNSVLKNKIYRPGMTLFIDASVRWCETVWMPFRPPWGWIDEVSFEQNICFDDLIQVNMPWFASTGRRYDNYADIPYDHPPCYDQYRRRLGRHDRRVYYPARLETLKDVADKHNICLQDLLDANPIWSSEGQRIRVPIVFIPDTMPCDLGQFYRTKGFETLRDVSLLYDVCPLHIQNANPKIVALTQDDKLPPNLDLEIPLRYLCWTTATYQAADGGVLYDVMISYACYRQPIDFNQDYSGTEPPLSLAPDIYTGYCYQVGTKPVLYENNYYDLVWIVPYETRYEAALCYGLDFEAFIELNDVPDLKRISSETTAFVPHGSTNTHCDWGALNAQLGHFDEVAEIYTVKRDDTVASIGRQFGYKPAMIAAENDLEFPYTIYPYQKLRMPERFVDKRGHMDKNGVYIVAYRDTLSSIGRQFGYLPSMIAAENDLEAPYIIYPYQELQMPRLPSLYDIGKGVLYVVSVGVGFTTIVLYRMRRRITGKKKQKPAA
jgi:LysM repeat protein